MYRSRTGGLSPERRCTDTLRDRSRRRGTRAVVRHGWGRLGAATAGMAVAMTCAVAPAVASADDALPHLDRRGAEVARDVEAVKAAPADGLLTGPSSASPESIALGYVRAHAGSFGLDGDDVDTLQLVARSTSPDGITHLRYDQVLDGVESYDSGLNAHVTRDGRLIEVTGHAVPDAALDTTRAAVGATASLGTARQAAHGSGLAPGLTASSHDSADFTTGETARLQWTDTAADGPRLAWSVTADGAGDTMYNVLVDASSGAVLTRTSVTDDLGQANVYPKDPDAGAAVGVTMPASWYDDNAGGTRLWGANARTYGDRDEANPAPGLESAGTTQIPASGQSDGGYDWLYTASHTFPGAAPCPVSGCTWNSDAGQDGDRVHQPEPGGDQRPRVGQPVPRPPRGGPDRLRRGVGQLPARQPRGRRRGQRLRAGRGRRRRQHHQRHQPAQQRELRHAARRHAGPDADVPVGHEGRQRRRRRRRRLARVRPRPQQPPGRHAVRCQRAVLRPGHDDGRGVERLLRLGPPRHPRPDHRHVRAGPGHARRLRRRRGRASAPSRSTARSTRRARPPRATAPPASRSWAATPTATSRAPTTPARTTAARCSPRRCGTCARRSARTPR